jgi:hypothetical protein
MSISWRPANAADIRPCLSIRPENLGAALIGTEAALQAWKMLLTYPFFSSAVLESDPPIRGHRLVGFGASVFVSQSFARAEIASPCADINSRILASIHSGRSVLADRSEVAASNANGGLDVVVLAGIWRHEVMTKAQTNEVQTVLPTSFVEWLAGYRIRSIHYETSNESEKIFAQSSIVYKPIAEFISLGRVAHLMTNETVKAVPASLGRVIFNYRDPIIRLCDSEQQLLRAALGGLTDAELASVMGISFPAIKARWRAIFLRISETMPYLVNGTSDSDSRLGRGVQKRHRVLAYIRTHPEELRPYKWNV